MLCVLPNAHVAARLVQEGDEAANTDLDRALQKYEEAIALDDSNADTFAKLARLQERKEDWVHVVVTLGRASQLAPRVASYRHDLGNALIELGKAGDVEAYAQAREPLAKCRELNPRLARCSYLLGFAEEWTDEPLLAAEHYREAIAQAPADPSYPLALASLYRTFRRELEAEGVLAEAAERVQSAANYRDGALELFETWAKLALRRGDVATARAALDRVADLAPQAEPPLVFELGALYATPAPKLALDAQRARRALMIFSKRGCRGAGAATFHAQCERSQAMIQAIPDVPSPPAPQPGASGPTPLPKLPPPELTPPSIKSGDAYTVAGVSYLLRAPQHQKEVLDHRLAVTGYIVKTNLSEAPRCVVHRGGVADALDCRADVPTFWLGDSPQAPLKDCIAVMGWASNYASIYDAIRLFDGPHPGDFVDPFWGQPLPNPLPAAGAKVIVGGEYSRIFSKASSGAPTDDVMGILSYGNMQELEPSLELSTLPGVKRKR